MASVTLLVQVGQKVSVTELESGCRLTVVDSTHPALTVVETAPDYVVLEDPAGEVKTRIPGYLIRGVTAPETVGEAVDAESSETEELVPVVPMLVEPAPVVAALDTPPLVAPVAVVEPTAVEVPAVTVAEAA